MYILLSQIKISTGQDRGDEIRQVSVSGSVAQIEIALALLQRRFNSLYEPPSRDSHNVPSPFISQRGPGLNINGVSPQTQQPWISNGYTVSPQYMQQHILTGTPLPPALYHPIPPSPAIYPEQPHPQRTIQAQGSLFSPQISPMTLNNGIGPLTSALSLTNIGVLRWVWGIEVGLGY